MITSGPVLRPTHLRTPADANAHRDTQSCALTGPLCCGEERCYLTVPSSIPLVIIYSVSRADLNLSCSFPSARDLQRSLRFPRTRSTLTDLLHVIRFRVRGTHTRSKHLILLLCHPRIAAIILHKCKLF